MKKMLRSLLCITMVMALFFSAITVPASAACRHYNELLTQGYMWSPTYYLKQDTALTGDLSIGQGGSARICLNGHNLYTGDYEIIVAPGTWLEICDCTGTGRICLESTYPTDTAAIRVNVDGTLVFMSGGIKLNDTSYYGSDNYGILNEGGTVTISGGSFSASISGTGASYRSSQQTLVNAKGGITNITGGSFSASVDSASKESSGIVRSIGVWASGGTVNITGGTFFASNYNDILSWQRCPFPLYVGSGEMHFGGNPDVTGVVAANGGFFNREKPCIYAKVNGQNYTGQTIMLGNASTSSNVHTIMVQDVTKGVNDTKFALSSNNSSSGTLKLYGDRLVYNSFTFSSCNGGDTGVVTKEATCSETGVRTYTCSVCGTSRTETIYKKSHTPGEAATATTPQTCTVCGEVIKPATLYEGEIVLEFEKVIYDGSEQKPKVTLGDLVEGEDFEVSYTDNVEIGIAKVTITGIGNYSGTVELEFEIIEDPAVLGDINLDGYIDAADLTILARHVAEIESLTDLQALRNGDVNCDGQTDAEDLTQIARYVAEIINSFEPAV